MKVMNFPTASFNICNGLTLTTVSNFKKQVVLFHVFIFLFSKNLCWRFGIKEQFVSFFNLVLSYGVPAIDFRQKVGWSQQLHSIPVRFTKTVVTSLYSEVCRLFYCLLCFTPRARVKHRDIFWSQQLVSLWRLSDLGTDQEGQSPVQQYKALVYYDSVLDCLQIREDMAFRFYPETTTMMTQ